MPQAVEYTPEDKGGKAGRDAALHGYYSGPGGGGAAACLGAKVRWHMVHPATPGALSDAAAAAAPASSPPAPGTDDGCE